MKIYLVGGAVRDLYLGLVPKDYDFVVVGSSPKEMLELGYTQVGKDFPVFLHPISKMEYALARTERKVGLGHNAFTCDWENVTLGQDLLRRDLTINSMAVLVNINENGLITSQQSTICDPFHGQEHIDSKMLVATSNAFMEDPLRVLRVARFRARLGPEWHVDARTEEMMAYISDSCELPSITPERVWKELESALGEQHPNLFFETLLGYDIFYVSGWMEETPQRAEHHPEGNVFIHTMLVLKLAAQRCVSPQEMFACYTHDFGKPRCHDEFGSAHGHEKIGLGFINKFCDLYKVPNKFRKLALHVCEYHTIIHGCLGRGPNNGITAKSIMKMFEATGALKSPEHFNQILRCCQMDAGGRGHGQKQILQYAHKPYPQASYLFECMWRVIELDTKPLVKKLQDNNVHGKAIGLEVRAARMNEIKKVKWEWEHNNRGEI
jgi:tRNA nucleotidyltransferase (CCA-adding enzyme)